MPAERARRFGRVAAAVAWVAAAVTLCGGADVARAEPFPTAAAQAGWLDAGVVHSCAVLHGGRIRCWGYGYGGALGYGNKDTIGDDETPASAATVDVSTAATTTTLHASENPSLAGRAVQFTATVANTGEPADVPSGTVAFTVDGARLGDPVTLDGQGHATIATSALIVGTHQVRAAYTPDWSWFTPSEATITQTIQEPTTTTLTITPDPSVAGQETMFTATVTAGSGTPTGTVQFTESDDTPIGDPQPLIDGRADLLVWGYAGHYTVRARFSGDSTFSSSIGSVEQTINRADTMTLIFSDPNPVQAGGRLTFDIYVLAVWPGYVQPAGTVAILLNGIDVSGPIPLFALDDVTAGVEVTTTAPAASGSGTIGALYSGDEDTNPSTSPTFTQVVSAPAGTSPTPTPTAAATPTPAAPGVIGTDKPPVATTRGALNAMTQPLLRALRRKGLNALPAVRQVLTVKAPGVLSQAVYTPAAPPGVAVARAKPVLIAKATHRFSAPGTGTLRLRVTAAGRRLARRAHAQKIEIVTQFTPTTGAPVTARTRLTVKPAHAARTRALAGRPQSAVDRTSWGLVPGGHGHRIGPP
jgi:hypothetical protein